MGANANFCTLNFLSTKGPTLSQGNCRADSTFYWATYYGTIAMPTSGKWYAECKTPNIVGTDASFPMGIQDAERLTYLGDKTSNGSHYIGMSTSTAGEGYAIYTHANGTYTKKYHNGSNSDTALGSASNNDIYQIAVDLDNNKLWFGKNNTWDQSNPSTNGTATYTITNKSYVMGGSASNSEYHIWNFGQDGTFGTGSGGGNADANGFGNFAFAPPSSGDTKFLALCSANLPISDDIDPAQTDDDYPAKNFNVVTWSGNSTDDTTISGVGFQSDFIWSKAKNTTESWNVVDTSRGVAASRLKSDSNAAESTSTDATGGCKSVNSDGFVLGTQTNWNSSSNTYVGYCWKANGGTTTSFSASGDQLAGTYQANTDSKFSIITYTGSGSADSEVLHGLGTTPNFIIWKDRGATYWWGVYLKSGGTVHTGDSSLLYLNSANALASNQQVNIVPDSTKIVFSGNEQINKNTNTYVMYAWADNEMQKFGMYEGNGNADGPFVYTGFRPRMLILKDLDDAENWVMFDSERNTYNPIDNGVFPNATTAETTGSGSGFDVDFLATGFKLRCTHDNMNGSSTYVYACWGDVPFKYNNTF
jgi:hypothetical protein